MADLFVITYISSPEAMEGFGIVALEACCAKLPVIASDTGGIRQAIHHGHNGFLIQEGNDTLFVNEIIKRIDNPHVRYEEGMRARHYVLKNFSWASISLEYKKIFEILSARDRK